MLKIFRNFNPQTLIVLLIFTILVKFGYWLDPVMPDSNQNEWLWHFILQNMLKYVSSNPHFYTGIGFMAIVLQSFLVNRLVTEYKLFEVNSFVPAALYILLSSFFAKWNTISAPMISAFFLLLLINNLLRLYSTTMPRKLLFNSGLIIGIGTLFYYPFLIYAILIIWVIAIIRVFKINDYIVTSLGLLIVPYFTLSIFYIFNLPFSFFNISAIKIYTFKNVLSIDILSVMILMAILILISGIILSKLLAKMTLNLKNLWLVVIISFIISNIVALFQVGHETKAWYIALVPASMLISNIWLSTTNKWIKIILFWLIIIFIGYLQWFN